MDCQEFDAIVKAEFFRSARMVNIDLACMDKPVRLRAEVAGIQPGRNMADDRGAVGPVLSAMWERPIAAPANHAVWPQIASGGGAAAWRYVGDALEALKDFPAPDILLATDCPLGTLVDRGETWEGTSEIHFALIVPGWQWVGPVNPRLDVLGNKVNWRRL